METRKEVSKLQAVQLGFSSGTPVEHVNIYDHLTPRLQTLLYEAKQFRQANNYKFCWAKMAKFIYAKLRIQVLSN